LTHAVDIEIEANDRNGLLQDVLGVASELKTQINSVNARAKRDKSAMVSLTAQISDLDHLQKLLRKLQAIKDVRNVWRVTKREAKISSGG
jgi:GTP pyrophosphokinase